MTKLLVVEDEKNVGSTLVERLVETGFEVRWCTNMADARKAGTSYDLAVLDVGLPDGNGFDLAKEIRNKHPGMPIVFLTAFVNPEDRIHGLEIGAEDYIVKPFHFKELVLRLENILKRSEKYPEKNTVQIGKATIYLDKYLAVINDERHQLTHKECELLRLLLGAQGKVVSRDEILDKVWSQNEYPTPRTIDNFVLRLRRLIESDPQSPEFIKSVRGMGYQLIK